ncbi:HK97 family phage prohead protease [Mobiluncus holmesii]|uniref:HK97 family phage prohead protease n=2 Tax=Mobiluncus porci TaxID=2652278 RepID=A0A7K0K565_9ACTO|nr:HK97 family phage prohead protease [Mobiluncus porci]
MRKFKDYQISGVKAGPDDGLGEGIFEAYASVFGNVDSYGDVVAKGAFANTLQKWAESGNVIPALYGHNMGDPFYNIGAVTHAEEDEHGLKVEVQLDLENPTAVQVYKLMKGRRLSQMSFAFDVLASGETEVDGEKANELRELQLFEVSVVPVGANQETEILSVKSQADALARGLKEGRVLAAKHINSLRKAQEAIGEVIEAAEATRESENAKASQTASPLTPENPQQVKGQEPAGAGHAAAVYAYLKLATLTGQN